MHNERGSDENRLFTYPLQHVSRPEGRDLPLLIVRCANVNQRVRTYEPLFRLQIPVGTTAKLFRVFVDIDERLGVHVLDLVNSRLQPPAFKGGGETTGRIL